MVVNSLICIGLALLPFAIWPGADTRTPKEVLALSLAILMILYSVHAGKKIAFKNIWFMLFIGSCFVSFYQGPAFLDFFVMHKPAPGLSAIVVPSQGIWAFKPLMYGIIVLFMLGIISSMRVDYQKFTLFLSIIAWTGFLSAVYVLIQSIGVDQFFTANKQDINYGFVNNANLGAFLGHPTLASPFIAMTIPAVIYFRKWLAAGIMALVVVLIDSQVGQLALISGLAVLLLRLTADKAFWFGLGFTVLAIGAYLYISDNPKKFEHYLNDNGRVAEWKIIVDDMRKPPYEKFGINSTYEITGIGPGSFKYFHSMRFNNIWKQAHNDYIELYANIGILGLSLFLLSIWSMFKKCHENYYDVQFNRDEILTCVSMLVILFVSALGTFTLQTPTFVFYGVVLAGLLHNNDILREDIRYEKR